MIEGWTVSLVIPCYNESLGLSHLLPMVPKSIDEILVVDNNSTDDTAKVAADLGAIVVAAPTQGYGAAYKVGFAAASGQVIVTLDGDGTYPVDEIERLVGSLKREQLDFISACRFPLQNPENMDSVSRFGNWVLTVAAKVIFGYALRREVLAKIKLESNGMPLSEEIKLEAIKRKLRFKEFHIPYHLRFGLKKIRKFRDGFHNLWFLFYLRFRK
jgi:dolichol-phosphate hexosyltransferase